MLLPVGVGGQQRSSLSSGSVKITFLHRATAEDEPEPWEDFPVHIRVCGRRTLWYCTRVTVLWNCTVVYSEYSAWTCVDMLQDFIVRIESTFLLIITVKSAFSSFVIITIRI